MRLKLCFALVLVVGAVGVSAPAASANPGAPGDFTCRASAFRVNVLNAVVFSEPIVANKNNNPCLDDSDEVANANVPNLAQATVLKASTDNNPGGVEGALSKASVETSTITLGGNTITTGVVTAEAGSHCSLNTHLPGFTSSGTVANLVINGNPIVVGSTPVTIPLGPITVYINRTITAGNVRTRRGIQVLWPGIADVVVAEAIADVAGCAK